MAQKKIIFMGTPAFAVESLKTLHENGHNIVAVITAPDKPSGRGQKLTASPVKEYALSQNIEVLQPTNLKSPEFTEHLKSFQADLQVVVAFRMLPEIVWNMPPMGTINLHASLLPAYRGAAPINHAVINGETETGVTTFFIQQEIDTGNILLREKMQIGANECASELHDRMMVTGAGVLLKTVNGIFNNSLKSVSQIEIADPKDLLKIAPKIMKEDCRINWNKSVLDLHNFIRGMSYSPGAFSILKDNNSDFQVKFFKVEPHQIDSDIKPGEIESDGKNYLNIYGKDGYLKIFDLQLAGKKRMTTEELLRGFQFKKNMYF